jgi:hypothetical protein
MVRGQVTQVAAAHVGEGYRIVQPDGTATAPVMAVRWTDGEGEFAEYGDTPVRAVLALDDGDELDLPGDAMLSVIWHADATDMPETRPRVVGDDADPVVALLRAITALHAGDLEVERLAARVSRGFTTPSGLEGVARLAATLYLRLNDSRHALRVCALISGEQFRGDHDRWTWIGRTLGLTHHVALADGDAALASYCRDRLAAHPPYAQRRLDEPLQYTEKIARALAQGDRDSEIAWRSSNALTLMVVRGTGRSRALSDELLGQLINQEIAELWRAATRR